MKKHYLLTTLSFIFLLTVTQLLKAQEKLTDGNMEDGSSWNVTQNVTDEALYATATFNYTSDIPKSGSGGALYVSGTTSGSWASTNVTIWQKVELDSGHTYVIDGAFKDVGGSLSNYWLQVFIDTSAVLAGSDYLAEDSARFQINTWSDCDDDYAGLDVTFQNFDCDCGKKSDTVEITTSGTYVYAVKMGVSSDAELSYEVVIDELSFYDLADTSSSNDSIGTSAVSDYESKAAVVSPNPYTTDLTVSLEKTINEVTIYDVLGQKIKKISNVSASSVLVSTSDLKPGAYYILVEDIYGVKEVVKTLKIEQ